MTDRQNDKLNMHIEVRDFCRTNDSAWKPIPVFGRYVNELAGHVDHANAIVKQQQGVPVKGVTAQKGTAEDVLVQECLAVGGALYALGFDSGEPALMETGTVNRNALYQQHGHLTLAKARNIAEAAWARTAQLADYGVGEDELAALNAAIAAYEALILSPREAISERKQYTGSLAQTLAAADSVLTDKMDRIVARFKNSNPAFYNGYKNARAIKDSGHRKATSPPARPQGEGAAQSGETE
jgi:hypothetical protein